jgi:beta-fructofuranosidase
MNGLESFGYMWECPDIIQLNGKDILLVSPQGLEAEGYLYNNLFQSGYFIGKLDYEAVQFQHGSFTELDRGFDFYAPQTFTDESGRTILYGWMGITDESEPYQPTIRNKWLHALTIPRVLEFRKDTIFQKPVEELKKLRKDELCLEKSNQTSLDGVCTAELILDFVQFSQGIFEVNFRHEAYLRYDSLKKEISLHRRNVKAEQMEKRVCCVDSLSKLHIFMDHSSLEIFINDGQEVFTARYFPNPNVKTISFNGNVVFNLKKWNLGSD